MLTILWQISVEGPPLGEIKATCPHCNAPQNLVRRAVLGRLGLIPIPSGEVLTCPGCGKHSRKESRASRLFGAAFLLPFILLLAAGVATGVYFLGSMLVGEFSFGLAAAAVGFIAVVGNLGYRTTLAALRLLGPTAILPMDGLMTRLW